MNQSAKLYINAVLGLGCLALGSALLNLRITDPALFAILTAFALIGAALKLRVPGIDGNLSISFIPMVLSAVLLSLPETMLMAFTATLVQCTVKSRKRIPVQIAFNTAAVTITAGAASLAGNLVAGQGVPLVQIALAGTVLYIVNSMLIATVIGLVEGRPLLQIWNDCIQLYLPYFATGLAFAALAFTGSTPDERRTLQYPGLAVLPVMLLVRHYFKTLFAVGANQRA